MRHQRLEYLVKQSQHNKRRQADRSLPPYPPFQPSSSSSPESAEENNRGLVKPPVPTYAVPDNVALLDNSTVYDPTVELLKSLGNMTFTNQLLSQLSPPLNATPGINDLTSMLQTILPEEVRAQIIASTPEQGFGVLSNFLWDSAGEAFELYLNKTNDGNTITLFPPFVQAKAADLQTAAGIYNNISAWKKDLPLTTIDALAQAADELGAPIEAIRAQKIEQRDQKLQAIMDVQTAAYEPVVNASIIARDNLMYISDRVDGELDTVLTPVNNLLTFYRRNKSTKYLAKRVGLQTMRICAINPICCESPELCAPVTVSPANGR
eukprot:GHVS01095323.1.p1 GENE.GHVS01095323.1~~GHVS01095323.1.p1  ORF type:complete len:350 (-),score=78.96 GHVS01095323.1:648-1613(-)